MGIELNDFRTMFRTPDTAHKKLARFTAVGIAVFAIGFGVIGVHGGATAGRAEEHKTGEVNPDTVNRYLKLGLIIGGIGGVAAGGYAAIVVTPEFLEQKRHEQDPPAGSQGDSEPTA